MNAVEQVHVHALPTFNATDDAWLLQDVTVVQEVSVCVSDGVIECVSMSVWAKVSVSVLVLVLVPRI